MSKAKTRASNVALFAAGALALSASSAVAAPAVVETDSNLRSGPGTRYSSMAVLPGGTTVDVQGCTGSWCSVAAGPTQGFVSRRLLSFGTAAIAPAPYPVPAAPYHGYGYGAPFASISYGFGPSAFDAFDPWYDPFDYGYGPGLSIGFGVGF